MFDQMASSVLKKIDESATYSDFRDILNKWPGTVALPHVRGAMVGRIQFIIQHDPTAPHVSMFENLIDEVEGIGYQDELLLKVKKKLEAAERDEMGHRTRKFGCSKKEWAVKSAPPVFRPFELSLDINQESGDLIGLVRAKLVKHVLECHHGNFGRSARQLGISPKTLRKIINESTSKGLDILPDKL